VVLARWKATEIKMWFRHVSGKNMRPHLNNNLKQKELEMWIK
jgi:hypothetical protein